MKKNYFYKGMRIAFLLAIIGICILLYRAYRNTELVNRETAAAGQMLNRLLLFDDVKSNIQSIEASEKIYIITGNQEALRNDKAALAANISALEQIKVSSPVYTLNLDSLKFLISKKVTHASQLVNISGQMESDVVNNSSNQNEGQLLNAQIVSLLGNLRKQDLMKLQLSNSNRLDVTQSITIQLVFIALMFIHILIYTYYVIDQDIKNLMEAKEVLKFNSLLIANISDPIITTDASHKIITWNSFAKDLYGYEEAEVKGKDVLTVLTGSSKHYMDKIYLEVEHQNRWKGEMQHQHKTGLEIFAEMSVSSFKNNVNKKIGAVYVVRDVSKRKSAEWKLQSLSKNLEKEVATKVAELNTVFDRITDAFIALDNNWNYTYVNKKASQLHGKPIEALLGKNIWEENPNVVSEPFYEALHNAKVTNQPIRIELYYSSIDTWFEDLIYPSQDGISVYYRDITERKKIQNELNEVEVKFRTLVEQSMVGVYIIKGDKFIYANPVMAQTAGYTVDEILSGASILDFICKEDHESVKKIIAEKLQGESETLIYEMRAVTKDARLIDVQVYGSVIQYQGEPAILGTLIDISDRKQALTLLEESEKALKISNERFLLVANATKDAVWDWNMLTDTIWGNEVFSALFNKSMGDEIPFQLFANSIHPNHQEMVNSKRADAIAAKENFNSTQFSLHAYDGRLLVFNDRANIIYNHLNEPVRMLGAMTDITEQKKNEEALRSSEYKYRLLFDQNPMPMWMLSIPERQFLDVNNAAINFYGYSKEEFLAMTAYDIRPVYEKDKLKSLSTIGVKGVNHVGIWDHQKKDGSLVQMDIVTHDVFYEGHEARLVLAIDVTEKVKAESALQQSKEEFRELATHLEKVRESERTHIAREIHDELGQQLTGLKMDISWLKRKIKSEDAAVQVKITETIALIDTTVKSVRRISTELRPSILDDLGLVAALEWQSEDFEKRSEITCNFSSNVVVANVHPDVATGIFRIYQECLTNVYRHAAASEVTAYLQIKPDVLSLHIADNGKGFIPDEIGYKKTLGILGMKERAFLMGGTYEISSTPGNGTSVIIIVPLSELN
jgi:PAS domain S-box-containing protein